MAFKLITFLATLSFLPLQTLSLTYIAYSSTNTCSGSAFGCADTGGTCCGGMPTGYGYSALFNDLPEGTQGEGYSSGPRCTNHIFTVFGPGTKCWNGGGSRAAYLKWFDSPRERRDEVGGIGSSIGGTNCKGSFAYFQYTDDKGLNKLIKVPADGEDAAQKIADLFEKQDFSALALYEKYIDDSPVSP